jgi:hypothetical protein
VVIGAIIIRGAPANSVAVPVTGVLVTKWSIPLGVNIRTGRGGTEG